MARAVVGRAVWAVIKRLPARRDRDAVLSFCGPAVVVALLLSGSVLPVVGSALIVHTALGTSVRATSRPSDTDFATALYVGCTNVWIASSGKYAPVTDAYRIFFVVASLFGSSVLALSVTYMLQLYQPLKRRNVLGLNLHLLTYLSADSAALLAGLGRKGTFQGSGTIIVSLADAMSDPNESHHFYPLLFFFFHPLWPYASVARIVVVALDFTTLIETALDDDAHGHLKHWAVTYKLAESSLELARTLDDAFVPDRYGQAALSGGTPPRERAGGSAMPPRSSGCEARGCTPRATRGQAQRLTYNAARSGIRSTCR